MELKLIIFEFVGLYNTHTNHIYTLTNIGA